MPLKQSKKVKMNFIQIHKECILTFFGIIVAADALLFAMFWPDIFNMMMAKEMALRPDSRVYEAWKSPPIDLKLDIYFFNWTNPEDSIKNNSSIKPIFEQIGPYRFSMKIDKVNIKWNPDNSTVTFKRKNFYYFDEENSNGSLDDMITTVNMVALSAGAKARTWGFVKRKLVSTGLNMYDQKIAITKRANELLFDGFQEDMIDAAREFPIFGSEVSVPFDRAGWFYPRNGSEDLTGIYNMFTGQDDIKKLGKMNTWNFKKHTGFFDSYCGMINGSAGEFYPPKLQKNGSISFFNPDLCRTVTFDYEDTVRVQNVEGYKFSGGQRSIDNGTLYPENECFCNGECLPSGVMNITACRFGAPVFMSYPHFYQADPYYLDQVEGLSPSKEKHQFYMILEPTTGIALEVSARFQINLLIRPIPNVNLYSDVKTVVMPILWFEQKVKVGEDVASELRTVLNIILIGQICAGIIFAIGLVMLLWFPIDKCIRRNHCNKNVNKLRMNKNKNKDNNIENGNDDKLVRQPEGSPLLEKTDNKLSKVKFIEPNSTNTTSFENVPKLKTAISEKSEKL